MHNDRVFKTGDTIRTGAGAELIRLPGDVTVYLEAHTELTLLNSHTLPAEVRLTKGRVVAAVRKSNTGDVKFVVNTRIGNIEVTGTVFAVDERGGEVTVQVLNGVVRVTVQINHQRDFTAVRSGESLAPGAGRMRAISVSERHQLEEIERQITASISRYGIQLIDDSTAGGDVPEPTLSAAAASPSHDRRQQNQKSAHSETETQGRTQTNLIALVREQRRRKDWAAAIQTYQEVLTASTDPSERAVACSALGQIQLLHQNNPSGVLHYFNQYLAQYPSGPLSPDVAFGRIRALRRLRRFAEEKKALKRFIAQYPEAVQTPLARERLQEAE
ncbi:MAG: FecR domain-containing protein [Deltaproteobacteria bacterium]|nr:FecR domain-containing protein [Deltaproteobacteria bacterium]